MLCDSTPCSAIAPRCKPRHQPPHPPHLLLLVAPSLSHQRRPKCTGRTAVPRTHARCSLPAARGFFPPFRSVFRLLGGAMSAGSGCPPMKVLASQLRAAVRGDGGTWRLDRAEMGREPLCLRAVWMQGTVLHVERGGGGSARLRDCSGRFTVLGVEDVPRGRPCLSAGKYVMVMGVVRSCSPEPVLRAIKMTDLSENPVHEEMWSLEVEELHRVIP
ncbi:protein CLEC16A isoform X5 [Excalfactoria chinensis]|uniref:protein CLEC16A isoform X5 n=1 Tax=Excalfactoria chinensis TaxID=46218 RepID=UPI003B3A6184